MSGLAGVAAYSQADPWHNNGWLFQYINVMGEQDRAEWARQFGRTAESLSADGTGALWNRWVSAYWDSRIRGVPQPLADLERQVMVTWLCGFKAQFSLGVERVLASPPAFLDHFTFYRMQRCGLADAHGAQLGRFLRGIMVGLNEVRYDTGELLALATAALNNGADPADMLALAGDMVRLGCEGGERLRELAGGGPA